MPPEKPSVPQKILKFGWRMVCSLNILIGTFLFLFFIPSCFIYSIWRRRKHFWKESKIKGSFFSNKGLFLEKFLFRMPFPSLATIVFSRWVFWKLLETSASFFKRQPRIRYIFLPVQSAVEKKNKKKEVFFTNIFFFKFSVRIYTTLIFYPSSSKEKRIW